MNGDTLLDRTIYKPKDIEVLRWHSAKNRDKSKRPLLIFSCGGNEDEYPSRNQLKRFVEDSKDENLNNVFFLNAENIAKTGGMHAFDLLTQEAIIADISDWLIIFAESFGSVCELGAFSSLPSSVPITSVVVDKKHRGEHSFIIDGPIKVIDSCKAPLSQVFYANIKCPLESASFAGFVRQIRDKVKESEIYPKTRDRKIINKVANKVKVGSFAHELLDLVALFEPIKQMDLIDLYCEIKNFKRDELSISSLILTEDMKSPVKVSIEQVLGAMHASDLLGVLFDENGLPLYFSKVKLDNYFMFRRTKDSDFQNMRARVMLRRRRRGFFYEEGLYRRFNRV